MKEKRSRIKPILARVRKEFNVAAAEVEHQDIWQTATIGLVTLSTTSAHTQRRLQAVPRWIESCWPDIVIEVEKMEII